MADEKQSQINNPYAISAFPFSESLNPQQYQSTAPPTVSGSGSKVEGTAMIADKFLEGFSRGRKMAFDRQEQSRNRLNQDINDAYGRIDKSDIPEYSDDPNATTKAKLRGRLDALKYADMYKEVHESKDKDNPAIKTLKSAFEGLVGPKPKKFEFGPAQVHQTLSGIWSDMDKAQTGPQLAEKAANDLTQYYSQNYGQPEGQPAAQPQGQPQQQVAPAQPAPAQQQSPNILPYGPGAQQAATPPGGPQPQGQIQQPQAGAQPQQMPTVMRQPAPQQAQTPPPPGAQPPQQPVAPPSQATSKDVMKDPEFMKRLSRVLTLDPKNPTAQLIVDRVKENDKLRSTKSLAEDIKGISGEDILEGNPNAKTAFGGPVKKGKNYIQGKDDKLYPVDPAASEKAYNPKTSWAIVEGSDEPVEILVDQRHPQNPPKSVITGEPLKGIKRTLTSGEITATIRSKSYGKFGEYYRDALGKGYTDAEAMAIAGQKNDIDQADRLARIQQQSAIDAASSGIGEADPFKGKVGQPAATPPAGVPKTAAPTTAAPPATARPADQSTTPPGGQAPAAPKTAVTPPAGTPKTTASATNAAAPAKLDTDNQNIGVYLGDLSGNTPATGNWNVRKQAGMKALQERSGLGPAEFQAVAAVDKDKIAALGDTVKRYNALVRLNSIMDVFTPNLLELAAKAPQTWSPYLNRKWRDLKKETVDDPNLRQYLVALNDFDRQYGTVTSGGGLSIAQLPEGARKQVSEIIDPNATLAGITAVVDQVKHQAVLEQDGMQNSLKKIQGELRDSALGRASTGQTPPPPQTQRRKVWNPATNKFDDK